MPSNILTLKLLPNSFKWFGYTLLFLSLIFILFFKKGNAESDFLTRQIVDSTFLLSLLVIALTKDKIEDERTLMIRLYAFSSAFLFGAIQVILLPVFDILRAESQNRSDAFPLLASMLLYYLMFRFIFKYFV